MELTQDHLEVASEAYFASMDGKGITIADHAYPAAHELAEQGWLQRRFEPDGEMSWWWTPAAEGALDLSALFSTASASVN